MENEINKHIEILERLQENAYGCAEIEDDIDVSLQCQEEFWAINYAIKAIKVLEKKDKIIDKMASQLKTPIHSKEWVIKYFTEEVEHGK